MLAVITAMMTIHHVMAILTKEEELLMIYAQRVAKGFLLNKDHVILIRSIVVAVCSNANVETIAIFAIRMQNQYLVFAPNIVAVSEDVVLVSIPHLGGSELLQLTRLSFVVITFVLIGKQ